jgi:hypothetical protein
MTWLAAGAEQLDPSFHAASSPFGGQQSPMMNFATDAREANMVFMVPVGMPAGQMMPGTVMMMQPGSNVMMPMAMQAQGHNLIGMSSTHANAMVPGTNIMMMPQVMGGGATGFTMVGMQQQQQQQQLQQGAAASAANLSSSCPRTSLASNPQLAASRDTAFAQRRLAPKAAFKQGRTPASAASVSSQYGARPVCPEAIFVDLSCLREKELGKDSDVSR